MHDPLDNERLTPPGSMLGTLLVRVIIPVYVLGGAVMKLTTATPDSLPIWLKKWLLDIVSTDIPTPDVILTALRSTIAVEIAAVGLMFFVPRLARITGGLILGAFLFVLVAEITYLTRTSGSGLMSAAFSGGCGCFGSASLPPGYMVLVDGLLLGGVVGLRPRVPSLSKTPKWSLIAGILWLVIGVSMALNMNYNIPEDQSWVHENPRSWVGLHFDETKLPEYVEDDWSFFGEGRQTWILYRDSCPVCHHLFETEYAGDLGGRVVVAVQLPTDPGDELANPIVCPDCQMTTLREGVVWHITSPVTIEIGEDGLVLDVIDQMTPHELGADNGL